MEEPSAHNAAVEDKAGSYYVYTVIPEFPSTLALSLLMLLALIAVAVAKLRSEARARTQAILPSFFCRARNRPMSPPSIPLPQIHAKGSLWTQSVSV